MSSERSAQPTDRRIEARVEARVAVRFGAPAQLADAIHTYSANVGMGGLCVAVSRDYEPGDLVQVRIDLEGQTFPMQAVVAWARKGFVGLRFQPNAPEHRRTLELIKRLMEQREASSPGPEESGPYKPFADHE